MWIPYPECSNLGLVSISLSKYSSLSFKYETLEKATDYFNSSRKIGEGGGGSVFKGTLSNGETVAVKRLFYNTRQWVDEFFNEVNLISGIQHKHLVKLLGCSIEGPESLLVYEYVPNRSLDQFLFGNSPPQKVYIFLRRIAGKPWQWQWQRFLVYLVVFKTMQIRTMIRFWTGSSGSILLSEQLKGLHIFTKAPK